MIKHAGPAHASVPLRYTDDDMLVEVRDDGHPTGPGPSSGGTGLIGMRERAAVHGGELDRRPRSPRRVRGQARLPSSRRRDVTIRAAIADDQPLVRAGFATMVSYADDLELVGEAENGDDAVAVAKRRPDVFLMDIRMPGLDGLEATRRITSDPELTGTRIIMLTTFDLDDYVHQALRNGASGFLLKDARPEDILNAVRVVAAGDALLAPSVTRRLIERFHQPRPADRPPPQLAQPHRTRTPRSSSSSPKGLSNAEIADRLYISLYTAKTHVSRILTKLHARDRAQLVMLAYETGLVTPGT